MSLFKLAMSKFLAWISAVLVAALRWPSPSDRDVAARTASDADIVVGDVRKGKRWGGE